MFVLKTTHELESNRKALTIAISEPETGAAARRAGAELVICRPIVPQKAKHAMLTCKAFVDHMPAWLPKLGFGVHAENPAAAPVAIPAERPWPTRNAQEPSSLITRSERPFVLPVVPAVLFEDDFIPNPAVQRAFSSAPTDETAPAPVVAPVPEPSVAAPAPAPEAPAVATPEPAPQETAPPVPATEVPAAPAPDPAAQEAPPPGR